MSRSAPMLVVATALVGTLLVGGCARNDVNATTRARIYGCLDRTAHDLRALPARGYALEGLGCADLDPKDVRAALPAWRAERETRLRKDAQDRSG